MTGRVVHTIYLGTKDAEEVTPAHVEFALGIVEARGYKYATAFTGLGLYKGAMVPTIIIKIAWNFGVTDLAVDLGRAFHQESVAIEMNGVLDIVEVRA
jgi:hypothetical protein